MTLIPTFIISKKKDFYQNQLTPSIIQLSITFYAISIFLDIHHSLSLRKKHSSTPLDRISSVVNSTQNFLLILKLFT